MENAGPNSSEVAENVAKAALNQFNQVTSKGKGKKPGITIHNKHEYTVLSSTVLVIPCEFFSEGKAEPLFHYAPISLATGLKAQPFKDYSPHGDVLHDSHSEVLSRRGLRKWLLQRLVKERLEDQEIWGNQKEPELRQEEEASIHSSSQLQTGDGNCLIDGLPKLFQRLRNQDQDQANATETQRSKLRDGIQVWFYISTLPCGDSSMKLMQKERHFQDKLLSKFLTAKDLPGAAPSSALDEEHDRNETNGVSAWEPLSPIAGGNPCPNDCLRSEPGSCSNVESDFEFLILRGRNSIEKLGRLRTKPGRADSSPSISHSCSDKLSLWSLVGMQGSILSRWLDPVFIDGIVIGDEEIERVWKLGQDVGSGNQKATTEDKRKFKGEVEKDCETALVDKNRVWIRNQVDSQHEIESIALSQLRAIKFPQVHFTSQIFNYSFSRVSTRLQDQQGQQVSPLDPNSVQSLQDTSQAPTLNEESESETQLIAHQLCLTWVRDILTENLNGGVKQGSSAKRKTDQILNEKCRSGLCKFNWFVDVSQAWKILNQDAEDEIGNQSYYDLKHHRGRVGSSGSAKYDLVKKWLRGNFQGGTNQAGDAVNANNSSRESRSELLDRFFRQVETDSARGTARLVICQREAEEIRRQQTITSSPSPFQGWLISGKNFEDFSLDGQSSSSLRARERP